MTLNTPSSVSVGVRPMMVSTRLYSSALRPKLWARDSLTGVCMRSCSGGSQRLEQRLAICSADQRIDEILRVRHDAEDAQVRAEDSRDRAGTAVQIGLRRQVAGPGGVAESDEILAVQPMQRGVIGEIVAVAVRHDTSKSLAGVVAAGERGVGALDPQVAIHRQES